MITEGGIDDNVFKPQNRPKPQVGQGKTGHLKKTNILYIQYIQYSALAALAIAGRAAPRNGVKWERADKERTGNTGRAHNLYRPGKGQGRDGQGRSAAAA